VKGIEPSSSAWKVRKKLIINRGKKKWLRKKNLKEKNLHQISNFYLQYLYFNILGKRKKFVNFYFEDELDQIEFLVNNLITYKSRINYGKTILSSKYLNNSTKGKVPIKVNYIEINQSEGMSMAIHPILKMLEKTDEKIKILQEIILKSYLISYIHYLERFPKYILELKDDMQDLDIKEEIEEMRMQFFKGCQEFKAKWEQYLAITQKFHYILKQNVDEKNVSKIQIFMENLISYMSWIEAQFQKIEQQNEFMKDFRMEENEKHLQLLNEVTEFCRIVQKRKDYAATKVKINFSLSFIENYFCFN
jgi:hypothetical protein